MLSEQMSQTPQKLKTLRYRRWTRLERCTSSATMPVLSVAVLFWEHTLADWEWVLGVNLWGVIHGIRSFVPRMLAQGDACHIVNTASILGLVGGSGEGIYKVSKHGVVALSETLVAELTQKGANIQVHVLCPGWVRTGILDSGRNRPDVSAKFCRRETQPRETIIGGSRNTRAEMEAGLVTQQKWRNMSITPSRTAPSISTHILSTRRGFASVWNVSSNNGFRCSKLVIFAFLWYTIQTDFG